MSKSKKPSSPKTSDTDTPDAPDVAPPRVEEEPLLPGMPENVTEMGRYETTDLGLLISGKFTFEQWRSLGGALRGMRENVFWWLGDWWIHGERAYGEMASQDAQDEVERETGYTYNTVRTAAYVCERIPFGQRLSGVSFKHHQVVAPIDSQETRTELLVEARDKNWSVSQLEEAARPFKKSSRASKKDPGLFDDDAFGIVYADPAWRFKAGATTPDRKVEKEYATMSLADICALRDGSNRPVQDITHKNAVLFLWTPASKNEEAMQVVNAWGFEYQTQIVWDKERIGLGHYARGQHEILLIATKGQPGTPKPKDRPPSLLSVKKLRTWLGIKAKDAAKLKHSEKPAEFRLMIERMYPKASRIELFARHRAEGWSAWGLEVPESGENGKRKKSAA